jgi:subtilase family serine protease
MARPVSTSAQPLRASRRPPALRRRAWLAVMVLACAIVAAACAAAITHPSSTTQPSSGATTFRAVGPAPAGEPIQFTLLLRLPGEARLQKALAAIENPRSPSFHHYIKPADFGARFGLSLPALHALERTLAADGLAVVTSYPQRTELIVHGTVGTVEKLLHVRITTYVGPHGQRAHAPNGKPVIPASLQPDIQGVAGLDSRPRFVAQDVPMGGITPALASTAYDVAPLHALGVDGQGETIGIVSFSAYNASDPATFASDQGITGPAPRVVAVDGGTTDLSGEIEANLDIDVVRSIAPQAQVLVFEVPQTTSAYADAINAMVADHITIISSSWGQCELELDPGEQTADTQALTAAVAAGVTMFVSSGDSGAYDCQQSDPTDHRPSVDWPAASSDAVAVGGTRLYVNGSGDYLEEGAWEDTLSQAGGGGGLATIDARPSWQTGPGVSTQYSDGKRQVPDVSAAADPGTPWGIFAAGQPEEVGGTSAAAPFWASSMLLIQQYAAGKGVSSLGFVDPILYALAATPQALPPFHDVDLGGNRLYQATTGWDYATGLGSPDVSNLAQDMVKYLKAHGG